MRAGRTTELIELLTALSRPERERLLLDWPLWARAEQLPPPDDARRATPDPSSAGLDPGDASGAAAPRDPWTTWLFMGGRGAGKTRAGAEWVRGLALGRPPYAARPVGAIALVAESLADLREIMVEGPSGVLACHGAAERPVWERGRRRLVWPNGAVAQGFSAEDPDSLRGPQFAAAWADEVAKWRQGEAAFDQLQFGLRLGARPRQMLTTTPRPVPLLRRLLADPAVIVTRAATRANAYHLAPAFLEAVVGRYAGTRLGRQELDGELVEEREGAFWTRDGLEAIRVDEAPPLERIVVAVDPPASSGARADSCGIVGAGVCRAGRAFVLADASLPQARPEAWASAALALYRRLEADALVVEINQGGEMAEAVLRACDPHVPVRTVRATRGKALRAEPVAALYAQNRVAHVGPLPRLEDEMADFGPDGLSGGRSPDRLDALVWALSELALNAAATPRVRGL